MYIDFFLHFDYSEVNKLEVGKQIKGSPQPSLGVIIIWCGTVMVGVTVKYRIQSYLGGTID